MNKKDNTIIDYLEWRGDITFEEMPLNEVDALIFTVFSFINIDKIFLNYHLKNSYLLEDIGKTLSNINSSESYSWIIDSKSFITAILKICQTKRFRKVKVFEFENIKNESMNMQFCALTFQTSNNEYLIAYRGTDNAMVGWKEDCQFSYLSGTPGQLYATKYANRIAQCYPGNITLAGHSKGGNFAVWAGIHMDPSFENRLKRVYNFDGPGLTDEMIQSNLYQKRKSLIKSYVPESSIVGLLLNHFDFIGVESTNISILQHDPLSWKIMGTHFLYTNESSWSSQFISSAVNNLVKELEPEDRKNCVNEIFKVFEKQNIKNLEDLKGQKMKTAFVTLPSIIAKIKKYGYDQTKKSITNKVESSHSVEDNN